MLKKWLLLVLWVHMSHWGSGSCGKVLVWPTDASHWLNIKLVLEELSLRGHDVTVLVPSANLLIDYNESSSPFDFEVLPVPFTEETMVAQLEDFLHLWMYEFPHLSYWEGLVKMMNSVEVFLNMSKQTCDSVVLNPRLIAKLQQAGFDVLISDPLSPGGELIAELLEIPFVYTFRFSDGNTAERLCGGLPAPPSYVPASTGGLTDRMSYMERLQNLLFYALQDVLFHQVLWKEWNQYYSDVLGRPTTLCETMGKAEMWLIRTYWDFEFPRPFLPNFEFVGGLHCKPAKPLPEEMEEFVQSSGEHGIVVFSLGSMIYNLTEEKSNMVALALSQIPQKVLWRYKGKKPETLGPNTRIYDWIPQNDLLGVTPGRYLPAAGHQGRAGRSSTAMRIPPWPLCSLPVCSNGPPTLAAQWRGRVSLTGTRTTVSLPINLRRHIAHALAETFEESTAADYRDVIDHINGLFHI